MEVNVNILKWIKSMKLMIVQRMENKKIWEELKWYQHNEHNDDKQSLLKIWDLKTSKDYNE